MSEFLEAFAKEMARVAGTSEKVMLEGLENCVKRVLDEGAEALTTNRSLTGYAKDVTEAGGAIGAESLTITFTRGASKELASKVTEELAAKAGQEGLDAAVATLGRAGEFSTKGNVAWSKIVKSLLSDETVSSLKNYLKEPGLLSKTMTSIRNNWGKLLIAGVTVEVVSVWLARGGGIQDLVDAIGNVVTDVAKNLIGAIAGVAKSVADPIGKGIGGALKTTGIILGAVAGVALLIYVIYVIVKKSKADKAKNKKV